MAGPAAILDPVDGLLRMFDTEADGKGLRYQGNPSFRQLLVGVVGGLTDGQDQPVRPNLLRTVDDNSDQSSPMEDEIRHLRPETDLTAHFDQAAPQIHHDLPQSVRPDVGTGVGQDFRRRPQIGQDPLHPARVRIFDPAGQLAVGKGPRPTLAEVDMAFRIQDPLLPERTDIGDPLRNGLTPLQEQDGHSSPGKNQGSKKPRRSATDNDRSAFRHRVGRSG